RYRISLARVLLKQTSAAPASPRAIAPGARSSLLPSFDALTALLTLTLQAPGLGGERPGSREAEKLADQVLAVGDKCALRRQALAIKGLCTRALSVYTAGLREKGLLAPEYANTLLDLINSHPALRRPESLATPDPTEGEKHYSSGLNFFFARDYANAEREFVA